MQKDNTKKQETVTEVTFVQSYSNTIVVKEEGVFENGKLLATGDEAETQKEPTEQAQNLMRKYYRDILSKPFDNIVILTGAGTSKSSGGKIMKELWDEAFPEKDKVINETFFTLINFPIPTQDSEKNIEELLCQSQRALKVLPSATSTEVSNKIEIIESMIVKACTIPLKASSPHLEFLNKVTSRKIKYPRVQIFNLNYDTLFEQAAAEGYFTLINGFSFSNPNYFNGVFFDYDVVNRKSNRVSKDDNFISKVLHLYKPHGSINWEKIANNKIVACNINEASKDPLIIYPNSNKYESGYDQPFFEMMSRFQQTVRMPNTLLLCVGFSFGDKHFKNVVRESAKSNPGLNLLVVSPNFKGNSYMTDIVELSSKQNNIIFINESFEDLSANYPFSEEYEHDTDQD